MKIVIRLLLSLFILAIGIFGFVYLKKTKPQNEPIQIEEQAWTVKVVSALPTALSPTITLYGRVESPRSATLRTPTFSLNVNTEVTNLLVLEGEKVKKGRVLIRLEKSDSTLNLKQREADIADIKAQIKIEKQRYANNITALEHENALLALTQKTLGRLRKLKRQRVSSQSSFEEAQQAVERQMLAITQRRLEIDNHQHIKQQLDAKLTRAVAQRDLARLELARTQITAPFSGVIADVFVAVGDRVRSGDALLSVYDNTALEIRAQIPGRYQGTVLDALRIGRKLQAQALVNNKPIRLRLERVSGKINPDSGGIDGLFSLRKGANLLRLGQFMSLSLDLPKQASVIALPYEAVYGTNRIYKYVDERMKGITIVRVGEQLTETGHSKILVRSPALQEGDQVIITQLPNAMEGLKVQVSEL
ncbi:MAG: HlyD family efflux transporter periplasmic adaptor subunit [Candidatus Parabeggiatoa sp.]|nr:HlyD family efflux transporter periplasmic adaptor subunit [Candidatus Parabeggiatoa sp.]